jgi:nitroreductase
VTEGCAIVRSGSVKQLFIKIGGMIKMTFQELLEKRESCRAFADRPVSREDIMKLVEAGRLSPSGCNAQPWKFIIVDEPGAKEKLCDALVVEGGATGAPFRNQVPVFIILVEQPARVMPFVKEHYGDTQRFAQGDIGMAAMNMCYQALELGLSTCILGVNDQKKMEDYFGIPQGNEVRLVLAVGYSAEEKAPRKKIRKSIEEICSFNHW